MSAQLQSQVAHFWTGRVQGWRPGSSCVPEWFCSVIVPGAPARPGRTRSMSRILALVFVSSHWEWFLQHTHSPGLNNLPPRCCPWPPVLCIVSLLSSFIFALFSSVAQSVCDPRDCIPEPTETHVHHVTDAIQPSHPLSSPSPPAFSCSQHQGLSQ